MYRPTAFQEDDVDRLVAFMRTNSFATLTSLLDGRLCASHIPLVVTLEEAGVKLTGHLSKQNPQWKAFGSVESLAIFTGAHAYISPALYATQENVPTWDYIAVHAYGVPNAITFRDARQSMERMIDGMVNTYEASYKSHWHSLSDRFREGMMHGIVGFEMMVTRLEGQYKLSQNRSPSDQRAISDSLLQSTDPLVRQVGAEIRQNLESDNLS